MKEIIQKFFGTTKKAVISITCALVVLALVGTATAYAAVNRSTAGDKTSQVFETADTNDATQSDTTASTEAITADAAKEVALTDAGLTADAVTFTKTELDYDNGLIVYDIEFYADNVEYEYEVNANTGAIYSKSKETYVTSGSAGSTTEAGLDTSAEMSTAAADAGGTTTASDTMATTSNTTASAETASTAGTTANTTDNTTTSGGATSNSGTTATGSTGTTTNSTDITLDTAKSIALTDAGVSSSDATFTKEKQDYENGVRVYDIEFYTSSGEYEYEIRVSDGTIVSKSVEQYTTSGSGSSTASDSYISVDEAKEIALNKAGLSSSDVTFKKAKLDRDDGIMVYEIEFYYGRTEYEVKVNATTGVIVEYEVDT
ncbi:MAG: PepSY domain-containing protein [Lachnospiraceae bacterium]|nr:PepSY domain-containing protein [Lachnospiraceae bacterium]